MMNSILYSTTSKLHFHLLYLLVEQIADIHQILLQSIHIANIQARLRCTVHLCNLHIIL